MDKEKPLSEVRLTQIFTPSKNNENYIKARESTILEYKESYNHAAMAIYFKTMAAFANTAGGYIIFGIEDNPRSFKGLSEKSIAQFDSLKIEEFTNNLNNYFQPSINWTNCLFEYRGKHYGIIYTYPSTNKPCICTKTYDNEEKRYSLEEGDIYYRYRGRSQKIKHAELRAIINENKEKEAQRWMSLVKATAKIGVSNASLLDITKGELEIDNYKIVTDERLINNIKFIKEGSFVENGGAPTLKLIGNIEGVQQFEGVLVSTPKLRAIEQKDIILIFLRDSNVDAPIEFIKSILNDSSPYLPIYYYINKSGESVEEVKCYIEKKGARSGSLLLKRLNGNLVQQEKINDNESASSIFKRKCISYLRNKTIKERLTEISQTNEQVWLLQSFTSLTNKEIFENQNYYKTVLIEFFEMYLNGVKGSVGTWFRKAISRVDEVLFFENNMQQK